jgi:hypothetical protein
VAYIALEEAFSIPELAARQPASEMRIRVTAGYASACGRKLADFAGYRLPDMACLISSVSRDEVRVEVGVECAQSS